MDQAKQQEPDAIEQALGQKWFWPILQKIEAFEESVDVFEEFIGSALEKDAQELRLNCVKKMAERDAKFTGWGPLETLDARRVGTMIGAKWVMCDLYAR